MSQEKNKNAKKANAPKSAATGNAKVVAEKAEQPKQSAPVQKKEAAVTPVQRLGDKIPPEHAQEFLLGPRSVGDVSNSAILYERFGYTHKTVQMSVTCHGYYDKDTAKLIGILPRIALVTVWEKASRWFVEHPEQGKACSLTLSEWEENRSKLEKYLARVNRNTELTVGEVMDIPELVFEELFLTKADRTVLLLKAAIFYEIEEINRLKKRWKKIKKYKHRVALNVADGGVFTAEETLILSELGIRRLNDIRKSDIYFLKHHLQTRDFFTIVEEINAAFKEDLERRKDKRYKFYPFLIGYLALGIVAYFSFTYQYTLIKDAAANTVYINALACAWILGLLLLLRGALRAIRRRRTKAPDYYYFTRKVRRATKFLAVLSLAILGATAMFYQRYDDYDSTLYYREVKEGGIAVAGLRNEEVKNITVPESVGDRQIVLVDTAAFKGDDIVDIVLPGGVTKIKSSAFAGCEQLKYVLQDASLGGVTEVGRSAFRDCTSLQTVDFSSQLRLIGDRAFEECKSFLDVSLDSAEVIGKKSFFNCKGFRQIVIQPVTQEIGKNAFGGCTSITDITLPFIGKNRALADKQSLNYIIDCDSHTGGSTFTVTITDISFIHGAAFNDCESVGEIRLPEYITEIEEGAFDGAKNLRAVNIPNAVTVLNKHLFKDCRSLTTITGGTGITTIGEGVFSGCSALVSVNFPSLTVIGKEAFLNCGSLLEIGEHTRLSRVEEAAFAGCASLSSMDLSSCSSDGIGEAVFRNCGMLSTVLLPAGMQTIPAALFDGCHFLNDFTFDPATTAIGDEAFRGTGLRTLSLHEGLTSIGDSAFESCTGIGILLLPESLTHVGKDAFSSCSGVYELKTPFIGESREHAKRGLSYMFGNHTSISTIIVTSMSTITPDTFKAAKSSLSKVVLGDGVQIIKNKSFKGYTHLGSISFGQSLTTVGSEVFADCKGLTHFDFGETNVQKIGKGAFSNCTSLQGVVLPGTLEKIPDKLFRKCTQLRTVEMQYGIREIGDEVFYRCTSLTSLSFPDSVTKLGKNVARYCSSLLLVELPQGLLEIPKNSFRNCTALVGVEIPASVKTIGNRAFYNCKAMSALIMHDGLNKIGKKAFYHCEGLTEVSIPSTVTKLGKATFRGCENLTDLVTPFVGPNAKNAKRISYITNSDELMYIEVTSAKKIAKKAFKNCEYLIALTLNEGITSIGEGVVDGCMLLRIVYLPRSLSEFSELFPPSVVQYQ
ncbi:MAG: leucine-rich repeat domain-containing protein [Ruminococcaceae bacterium]|nr:leucine-rich repeat domain-containing protein [Oscillospiraceae bacterium]